MKLKDIKIGVEYFANRAKDWEDTAYGIKRVRVLDKEVKKWRKLADGTWGTAPSFQSGWTNGVLVEELNEQGKVVWTGAVTVTSIRGEWKTTFEHVEARLVAIRAHAEQFKQEQLRYQLETGTAVAKAQMMGIPV